MKRKIEVINNELGLSLDIDNIKDMNGLTWEFMIDMEMFTYDELRLVTDINGYNVETLNGALFSRYGYRDIEQYIEAEYNININD